MLMFPWEIYFETVSKFGQDKNITMKMRRMMYSQIYGKNIIGLLSAISTLL